MDPTKQQIWDRLQQAKNTLKDRDNADQFTIILSEVKSLVYPGDSPQKLNATPTTEQQEFMSSQYVSFLEFLLEQFSVDWIKCIPPADIPKLVDVFFIHGCPSDAFLVLCNAIANTGPGFRLNKVVSLLESLLKGEGLKDLLIAQSGTNAVLQADLTTFLVTIPERVINKLQGQAGDLFYPTHYIHVLCTAIMTALDSVHTGLKQGQSSKLDFLCLLVGKLALHGHADALWTHLLPKLVPLVSQKPMWARIAERLVTQVPPRYIQATVTPLVQQLPWYGHMSHFLGNAVMTNSKLKFLLTHKLFLQTYSDQDLVLQNILGYFTSSGTLRPLFIKVLREVLEVWGDVAAVKHTPYEQHLYLSRALMVCVAFMGPEERTQCQQESPPLMGLLLSGMQCHLDNGQVGVRTQGMVVAEALTPVLETSLDHKLKFEYEETEEVKRLKSLLQKPSDPGIGALNSDVDSLSLGDDTSTEEPQGNKQEPEEELDSDDDLEPYDMSHDQKKTDQKTPLYLRDCMEGLISSEDPVYLDVCLKSAEKLIRQHPDHATELSTELMKVLLHLSHPHAPEFRLNAMRALTVCDPKRTALYLTSQVYERNYNVSHRVDILQVLAIAAQELSSPPPAKTTSPQSPHPPPSLPPSSAEPHWKEIVQKRIESNTRRISKGRPVPLPSAANRFAGVAGCFFFPLLAKFDQKQSWLDLFGDDHFLLTRLTYTLGVVMRAATHAPIVSQMAPALMEYILVVRYHAQAAVRQAVLFATCMLLLAVPSYSLLMQYSTELGEIREWLQSVSQEDVDVECRKLSVEALVLINNAVSKEFHKETGDPPKR